MRSRYTAYVFNKPKYIIRTTHPKNIDFQKNTSLWIKSIEEFSLNYTFEKLTILDFIESYPTSYVTFCAKINLSGEDNSFCEKSSFEKLNNKWLYLNSVKTFNK